VPCWSDLCTEWRLKGLQLMTDGRRRMNWSIKRWPRDNSCFFLVSSVHRVTMFPAEITSRNPPSSCYVGLCTTWPQWSVSGHAAPSVGRIQPFPLIWASGFRPAGDGFSSYRASIRRPKVGRTASAQLWGFRKAIQEIEVAVHRGRTHQCATIKPNSHLRSIGVMVCRRAAPPT